MSMDPKEEIKQKLDLADMIGEYIQLKPAGTHAFKALCPFHSEKTPSFHVSRDKQIWRCFGCGVGGDVFSFVMQMEGVDFPEALRILGRKAGVQIERYDTSEANEKARAQRVQNFAAAYYHKMLLESPKAVEARAYVERRGITSELVEKFQLGYASDEWDTFVTAAKARGINDRDLSSGGLALTKKSGSGLIDRFRNRLMIPLGDVSGNAVGFTGRVLNPEDQPKYMNSPETVLYKKSALLYGLDLAKQAIRHEDVAIIVEGNLDVIASHKAGVEYVVASSGTALTQLQLQLLKRFTTKLIFCFDADAAGFAAAKRGIQLAQSLGFDVAVVLIAEDAGKDPDDVVAKSPQLWRDLVRNTVPIMEYYFSYALRGKDLMKIDDKRAVGKFLLPEVGRLTDVVEREHWLQKLGMLLHIETEVLRGELTKGVEGSSRPRVEGKGVISPAKIVRKRTRSGLILEQLIGLFIEVPELREEIKKMLPEALICEGDLKTLYRSAIDLYTQSHSSANHSFFNELRAVLNTDLQHILDEVALLGEQAATITTLTDVRRQFATMIDVLRQAAHDDERRALLSFIRQAEAAGDGRTVGELMQQLHQLR